MLTITCDRVNKGICAIGIRGTVAGDSVMAVFQLGESFKVVLSEIIRHAEIITSNNRNYFAFFRNVLHQIKESALLLDLLGKLEDNDHIGRLSALTRLGEITDELDGSSCPVFSEEEEKGAFLRGVILGECPSRGKGINEMSVDLSSNLPLYHLLAMLDGPSVEAFTRERIILDSHCTASALRLSTLLGWHLFSEEDIQRVLENGESSGFLLRTAIDYAGEIGFKDLLKCNRRLAKHEDCSVIYSYLDALAYSEELDVSLLAEIHGSLPPAMKSLVEALISSRDNPLSEFSAAGADRIILAQTVFHGDPSQAGKGSAGGVGTLLSALAGELPSSSSIHGVCTITAVPTRYWGNDMKTFERLSPDHTVMRIPVCSDQASEQGLFGKLYPEILLRLRHSMKFFNVRPNIFHLRYADFATLAASKIARETGAKIVFTVTPDPHRRLSSGVNTHTDLSIEKASKELTKVFISDWLIRLSDGLIGIGGEHSRAELESFFPELSDRNSITGKKLVMLPEGVIPGEFCPLINRTTEVERLLFDSKRRYRLSVERRNRPAILTVGRLNNLKGQHRLVQAWAKSQLSRLFNLILIGGDLESPSDEEQEVLSEIHSVLLNSSNLDGAFCHLPALENRTVRCLQNALASTLAPGNVNIYVAPSLKEEFGLAILEAMSAGFLAIAPEVGGVSTYIKNETNGFLINTATSETIQKGLEHILLERNYRSEDLRKIAGRGMKTVLNEYNLKRIARRYAQYYTGLFASAK